MDQGKKGIVVIVITAIVVAILVGGGVYMWQKSELMETELKFQQQISYLQGQIYYMQQDNPVVDKKVVDERVANDVRVQNTSTTLKKISDDGRIVSYDGSVTVSGVYQEFYPQTLLGGELCFYVDAETGGMIPRDPNLRGPGNGDSRKPWFCFNGQENVKKLFGIDDAVIFSDKTVECIRGKATVVISNYKVDKLESEVFDTADLVQIISKEAYGTKCE